MVNLGKKIFGGLVTALIAVLLIFSSAQLPKFFEAKSYTDDEVDRLLYPDNDNGSDNYYSNRRNIDLGLSKVHNTGAVTYFANMANKDSSRVGFVTDYCDECGSNVTWNLIYDAEDLTHINDDVNAHYRIMRDINLQESIQGRSYNYKKLNTQPSPDEDNNEFSYGWMPLAGPTGIPYGYYYNESDPYQRWSALNKNWNNWKSAWKNSRKAPSERAAGAGVIMDGFAGVLDGNGFSISRLTMQSYTRNNSQHLSTGDSIYGDSLPATDPELLKVYNQYKNNIFVEPRYYLPWGIKFWGSSLNEYMLLKFPHENVWSQQGDGYHSNGWITIDFYAGLFGKINGGTVKDLCIIAPNMFLECSGISNSEGTSAVGLSCSDFHVWEAGIHTDVSSQTSRGPLNVSANIYAGALAGCAVDATIEGVYVKGANITTKDHNSWQGYSGATSPDGIGWAVAGGIVGIVKGTTSINGCAVGESSTDSSIITSRTTVAWAGDPSKHQLVRGVAGGLVGMAEGYNADSSGIITISNSYFDGNLIISYSGGSAKNHSSCDTYMAGLLGGVWRYKTGSQDETHIQIYNSFAIINTSSEMSNTYSRGPQLPGNKKISPIVNGATAYNCYYYDFEGEAGAADLEYQKNSGGINNLDDSKNKYILYYAGAPLPGNAVYEDIPNKYWFNSELGFEKLTWTNSGRAASVSADTVTNVTNAGLKSSNVSTSSATAKVSTANNNPDNTANNLNNNKTNAGNGSDFSYATTAKQTNSKSAATTALKTTQTTDALASSSTKTSTTTSTKQTNTQKRPLVNLASTTIDSETPNITEGWTTRDIDGEIWWEIDSVKKLRAIDTNATTLSRKYILVADLDLSKDEYWSDYGWVPIGGTSGFTGVFDGNGHSLSNLKIISNASENGKFWKSLSTFPHSLNYKDEGHTIDPWSYHSLNFYCGLFSYINAGTVKDLQIVSPEFKIRTYDYSDYRNGTTIKEDGYGFTTSGTEHGYHWERHVNNEIECEIYAGFLAGKVVNGANLTGVYVTQPFAEIINNCHTDILKNGNGDSSYHYTVLGGLIGVWEGEASAEFSQVQGCSINGGQIAARTQLGYESKIIALNDPSRCMVGGLIGWIRSGQIGWFNNNLVKADISAAYNRGGDEDCATESYMGGLVGEYSSDKNILNLFGNYVEFGTGSSHSNSDSYNAESYKFGPVKSMYCSKNLFYNSSDITNFAYGIKEDREASSATYVNENAGINFLGWSDSGSRMRRNALETGMPIPRAFAYNVKFDTGISQNVILDAVNSAITVKGSDGTTVFTPTKNDNFDNWYFEDSRYFEKNVASVSVSLNGTDGDYHQYLVKVGNVTIFNIVLKDYSKKAQNLTNNDGTTGTIYAVKYQVIDPATLNNPTKGYNYSSSGAIQWDNSRKINLVLKQADYDIKFELTKGWRPDNEEGTADSHHFDTEAAQDITIVSAIKYFKGKNEFDEDHPQTLELAKEKVSYLKISLGDDGKYIIEVYTTNETGNNVYYKITFSVADDYKILGLYCADFNSGREEYIRVGQDAKRINNNYYQVPGDNQTQVWQLVFQYETKEFKLEVDTGGKVCKEGAADDYGSGKIYAFDYATGEGSETDVKKGNQTVMGLYWDHPDEPVTSDTYNFASAHKNTHKIRLYFTSGTEETTTSGNTTFYNYYINPYNGYEFEKWTVTGGESTERTTAEGIKFLEVTLSGDTTIKAWFKPIVYELNLWDENITSGTDLKTSTFGSGSNQKTFRSDAGRKIEYTIEDVGKTTIFNNKSPADPAGEEESAVGLSTKSEPWWAIIVNSDGNLIYNSNLTRSEESSSVLTVQRAGDNGGNWNFNYGYRYNDVSGNTIYLVTGLSAGSWGDADIGENNNYTTATVNSIAIRKYKINIQNTGAGNSLWKDGEDGSIINGTSINGNVQYLLGVGGKGDSSIVETSGGTTDGYNLSNLNIVSSALKAFDIFSTTNSEGGSAFYKGGSYRDKGGAAVANAYNLVKKGQQIPGCNYYLYNFGSEITAWTIRLSLTHSINIKVGSEIETASEFYLNYVLIDTEQTTAGLPIIYGEWKIQAKVGTVYYELSDNENWKLAGNTSALSTPIKNFTVGPKDDEKPVPTEDNPLVDVMSGNGKAMSMLCLLLDKVFVDYKDIFTINNDGSSNYTLTMTPTWEYVNIGGTYNNVDIFSSGLIKFSQEYSFSDALKNLAPAGETLAYLSNLEKYGICALDNARWNYYQTVTPDFNRAKKGNDYYYDFSITDSKNYVTLNNIYRVNLQQANDIKTEWTLDDSVDKLYRYQNWTSEAEGTKRTANVYTYFNAPFNWINYKEYGELWSDNYFNNYFGMFEAQYNAYCREPYSYDSDSDGKDNRIVLTKPGDTLNLLMYVYPDGDGRYIYLANDFSTLTGTKTILPAFLAIGDNETRYYKLNYWYDGSFAYNTPKWEIEDGAKHGSYNNDGKTKAHWSLKNWVNNNGTYYGPVKGEFYLQANFFREYYRLTVGTYLQETLESTGGTPQDVGYALVCFEDSLDKSASDWLNDNQNSKTIIYLVYYKDGKMAHYDITNFIGDEYPVNFFNAVKVGKETNNREAFKLRNWDLANAEANVKFYAGCNLYIYAFDQSKDPDAAGSGKFNNFIGYKLTRIRPVTTTMNPSSGADYDTSSTTYYKKLTTSSFAKWKPSNLKTGNSIKLEIQFNKIEYKLDVRLPSELTPGTLSISSSDRKINQNKINQFSFANLKIDENVTYTITYVANAGYKFKTNAFTLNWGTGENAGELVLQTDEKQDGGQLFIQTYSFVFDAEWLRINYYAKQDTAYTVPVTQYDSANKPLAQSEDVYIGVINVNTDEIDFKLNIKYLNMDTGEWFDDIATEQTRITVFTRKEIKLVDAATGRPYGMTTKDFVLGGNTYTYFVYQSGGKTYALVKTYMYQVANIEASNLDPYSYNLPYFTTDINNKTYYINNNITSRVDIPGEGGIIPEGDENRTIYYVFAVRELVEVEVEVGYPENEMNNSERTITLSNALRKDNAGGYKNVTNTYTLSLSNAKGAPAYNNGTNYVWSEDDSVRNISSSFSGNGSDKLVSGSMVGSGTNLMKFFTYRSLNNNITSVFDAAVRYEAIKFFLNNTEIENSTFDIANYEGDRFKLRVEFTVLPLNVNVSFKLNDFINDRDFVTSEQNVEFETLVQKGIVNNAPVLNKNCTDNKMFIGNTLSIDASDIGLNMNYQLICKINGVVVYNNGAVVENSVYTASANDYANPGCLNVVFSFEVLTGGAIKLEFNVVNDGEDVNSYFEGENIGNYTIVTSEKLDDSEDYIKATESSFVIENSNKILRIVEGRKVEISFDLNEGYYYYGYNYANAGSSQAITSNFVINEFNNSNTVGFVVYLKRYNVNINLVADDDETEMLDNYSLLAEQPNADKEFKANSELTMGANQTVYIQHKQNMSESLLYYYIMVNKLAEDGSVVEGESEMIVLDKTGDTGKLELSSELLSRIGRTINADESESYNLTVYVKHQHNFKVELKIFNESYLSEGSGVESEEYDFYNAYIVNPDGTKREVSLTDEDGNALYFIKDTKINIVVNLFKTSKYKVVTYVNNQLLETPLNFVLTLDEDKDVVITCQPENFNLSVDSTLYRNLSQLEGKEPATTLESNNDSIEYNEPVLIELNLTKSDAALRLIRFAVEEDAPVINISVGNSINVTYEANDKFNNVKIDNVSNTITISWQEVEDSKIVDKTYSINYSVTEDKLLLDFVTANNTTLQVSYLSFKLVNHI